MRLNLLFLLTLLSLPLTLAYDCTIIPQTEEYPISNTLFFYSSTQYPPEKYPCEGRIFDAGTCYNLERDSISATQTIYVQMPLGVWTCRLYQKPDCGGAYCQQCDSGQGLPDEFKDRLGSFVCYQGRACPF